MAIRRNTQMIHFENLLKKALADIKAEQNFKIFCSTL